MGNNCHNVFIPGYPMLITDTWSGYQAGLEPVEVVTEKPDHPDYYEMKGVHYNINELKDRSGEYHVYPKGWDMSYRATFVALANALYFEQAEDEKAELADSRLAELQQQFISGWEKLSARIDSEKDPEKREEIMTAEHMRMSEEAHSLALALYRHLVYEEPLSGAETD